MKKLISFIAIMLVATSVFGSITVSEMYVGNMKSKKYHRQTCRYIKQMSCINIIYLNSSEEAIKKGYMPCKVCRPPIMSEDEDGE